MLHPHIIVFNGIVRFLMQNKHIFLHNVIMTQHEVSFSDTFREFYLDESLTGHLLLRPSLFVGRSYQRIISANSAHGVARVAEVFTRILLFVVLPLIAIVSLLLVPFGLAFKGISAQFRPATYYYSKNMAVNGQIRIPDNGDCLFESFHVSFSLNLPHAPQVRVTRKDVLIERQETVQWIRDHFQQDKNLQNMLLQSMLEHYQNKLNKFQQEVEAKKSLSLFGQLDATQEEQNKQTLIALEKKQPELQAICERLDNLLCSKNDEDPMMLVPIMDVVEAYLHEMKVQGEFGGGAELYALSSRYQRCVKVHKAGQNPEVVNAHFVTEKTPALHLRHSSNHYTVDLLAK